ncbi:hypothetical protein DE146DRAFT_13963 [Phaeosphaeria sp. MPI-PUGE-AT-0046c]|nr:hypothetical protein DE146DRAFT_13963 [Phaeosphaeria sp. MPI-PUGE-AT-0046c]
MVNTGKASHGCAVCRQRKIKVRTCDLARPACSQCVKAGWDCPGPKHQADVIFKDQTALVKRKVGGGTPTNSESEDSVPQSPGFIRAISPSTSERGTAFFMHQYVVSGRRNSRLSKPRGLHEYLPTLLRDEPINGPLRTIVAAAGLAALSNAGNAKIWAAESYQLYNQAVRQLRHALSGSVKVSSDETLAAMMLMSTFEAIASGDLDSMKFYGNHTMAAGRCIGLRGPAQFRNDTQLKMFLELRRTIFMTCHQLQTNIPSAIQTWSSWAEPVQQPEERCSNSFTEINIRLSNIRADLKQRDVTSPDIIITELLPIEEQLHSWKQNIPRAWQIETFCTKDQNNVATQVWRSRYYMYDDFWKATVWNGFRSVRMVIHEAIINAIITSRATKHQEQLQLSMAVLKETVDDICASVPYLLDHVHKDEFGRITQTTGDPRSGTIPRPGGWVLVWPLFQAAMVRTTPRSQRDCIAAVLRNIGLKMGLKLAISMAERLAKCDTILADGDTWLTGEFTTLH